MLIIHFLIKLQGFRRNDRKVRITMNVTINDDDPFTDFFWIVQRKYIIYEGDEECPDEERGNCYLAKRRRRIRGAPKNLYKMRLDIDELSRDDLSEPVVLIKDYRDRKTRKDIFQLQFVPKLPPLDELKDDNDDDEDYDDEDYDYEDDAEVISFNDRTSFARKRVFNNCVIKNDKVDVGKSVNYPNLCVKLVCLKSGNVDVRSMNEQNCRERKTRGQGAKRIQGFD